MKNQGKKIIIIVGPTASGKTKLSIDLALRCKGEIVSADSRQIYRYMDIGTAKPSEKELNSVKHHFINELNPDIFFSAGKFGKLSRKVVNKILSEGKIPIITGGSGLYIRSLVDGIFSGNYKDFNIREKLEKFQNVYGKEAFYKRLEDVDPEAAERIHPNDTKRIIRALEVFEISGKPISTVQKKETKPADFISFIFGIKWPREKLYNRIDKRVDLMIESGLIDEVKSLLLKGYSSKMNSLDSLGYKEVISYLNGDYDFNVMVDKIKTNTRHFAKRQLTWFRKDQRIDWIDMSSINSNDRVVDYIMANFT